MNPEKAYKLLQDMIDSAELMETEPRYIEAMRTAQVALKECALAMVDDCVLPDGGVDVNTDTDYVDADCSIMGIEEFDKSLVYGMWVAYTEDGLKETINGQYLYCWPTKKDCLEDLMAYKLEPRKHPKIRRIRYGLYEYIPGDCDNWGHDDGTTFTIERITKENISDLQEMLDD